MFNTCRLFQLDYAQLIGEVDIGVTIRVGYIDLLTGEITTVISTLEMEKVELPKSEDNPVNSRTNKP